MKVTEHLAKAKKTLFSIEILPPLKGGNDVYALYADGLDIINVEAFILDASSRRVGFINNMSSYWDGKDLKGNILPNGHIPYYSKFNRGRWNQLQRTKRNYIKQIINKHVNNFLKQIIK